MDYFSHGLWSYIFFNKIKKPIYAVLFGLLPDTMSWFVFLVYNVIKNDFRFGPPDFNAIPDWVFTLYGISHSLVVSGGVFLIVYLILRRIPVYMYAWPIAILIDIVTHTRDFLPTPFLWPISEWKFPGFSWANPYFMLLNYSLIVILGGYLVWRKRKESKTPWKGVPCRWH